jgi:tripartite-type tricarboxylate transporter receptor subunit TctC
MTTIFKKSVIGLALSAFALIPVVVNVAHANQYPNDVIRLVMPYPPGGMSDVSSRAIAAELSKKLGSNIVVENRPGAASTVASNYIKNQKADGYTLYAAPVSLVLNPMMQEGVAYKPYEDYSPISMMIYSPFVLQVNKDLGVKSVAELVSLIKKNPGRYAIGTSGVGSINHLSAEYFIKQFGLDMVVAHYKGGTPAAQDLIGGQIHMMFSAANEAKPMMEAGRTQGLAVTTQTRLPILPDLPTMAEATDLKDFEAVFWMAMMGPAGLPEDIQTKLSTVMQELKDDPAFVKKMDEMGVQLTVSSPAAVTNNMKRDEQKWGEIIQTLDLKGIK